ncbi:hypothetical protein [Fodinicola feengrottensis]|uniref:hypothetical protein n=1 Tax=Fodinicola feengrottensis TaxID=435914 RepID=UPI0013D13A3F|nr:hypothetical protein [Fodinicola feengrottensis]
MSTPAPPSRRIWWIVAAAAIVMLLVCGGVVGVGLWAVNKRITAAQIGIPPQAEQAVTTAADLMRRLFSYDYRHLDADLAAGLAVTTGPFRQRYAQTMAQIKASAPAQQIVISASVVQSGVISSRAPAAQTCSST